MKFFPIKTVTTTSSDAHYITSEITSLLRERNSVMHKGHIKKANTISLKVGKLITKTKCQRLTHLHSTTTTSVDLWAAVKRVTGKKQNASQLPNNIYAECLNNHYSLISTDANYCKPMHDKTR